MYVYFDYILEKVSLSWICFNEYQYIFAFFRAIASPRFFRSLLKSGEKGLDILGSSKRVWISQALRNDPGALPGTILSFSTVSLEITTNGPRWGKKLNKS